MDKERVVYERYTKASQKREESLCCPVEYDKRYLEIIPEEILEKDYGCGDPSTFVIAGETVLDLGSGGGKLCYIIAQIVGKRGKVIGVDMNEEMLSLARKYEDFIAKKLGYKNFEFKRGRIQNLRLDLEKLDQFIKQNPVKNVDDYLNLEFKIKELEEDEPLIGDNSIDVVVSNCVLNLVRDDEKKILFKEIYRVLKKDGRAVISDIVCDRDVPNYLKNDPELWSGCISGALKESDFIKAFEDAGFGIVKVLKKDNTPWRTIDGINFYSITVAAYKGDENIKYKNCCGKSYIDLTFKKRLELMGIKLKKQEIKIAQINVGNLCNQTCNHCHVYGGNDSVEIMSKETMSKILSLIKDSSIKTIDITGGAPELNPYIDFLVESAKNIVPKVIFRTNLTALEGREWLITLLRDKRISLYASLPSVNEQENDSQRGKGVFKKSIEMLKKLNECGFGKEYELNIVYNPVYSELSEIEYSAVYSKSLKDCHGISFNNLITITNAPIGRFEKRLRDSGKLDDYLSLLKLNFNECNLQKLMCKELINFGADGFIYDCDFNNALKLKVCHIDEIKTMKELNNKKILVGEHCFACTAQRGSSCFGSLSSQK